MARDDDAFIHFQECLSSLNQAWRILDDLPDSQVPPVLWVAAYRMAIIEYAKSFKDSYGANKRRYKMKFPLQEPANTRLHLQLIGLRDQVLAHSDLSVKDAKIYLGKLAGKPFPLIISNGDPQYPDLASFKLLVERTLDAFYAQIPCYERQFE